MDKYVDVVLRALSIEGWHNLVQLFDLAADDICRMTRHYDQASGELKATGARIVFLPNQSYNKNMPILVHEFGIPAKPEKYLQLAAEKANRVNSTGKFSSAESRDPEQGKYGGAHATLSNVGAIGLSGLAEADDHVVLAFALRAAGLLYESDHYNDVPHNRNCLSHAETITFNVWPVYSRERFDYFETIFAHAKIKLQKLKDDMEYIREHTAS